MVSRKIIACVKFYFILSPLMNLFYAIEIKGNFGYFNEEEARHCVQVLRKKVGDLVHFVDGFGGYYQGKLVETGKKNCVAEILNNTANYGKRSYSLHLGIAPTKNIARFEWFLEKATEIGVDKITPLLCQHSERRKIRMDRLQKILITAMKQSLKAYLPKLNELLEFNQFMLASSSDCETAQKYIAHCLHEPENHLKNNFTKGQDVILVVGPEGDFSEEEIGLANAHGFRSITLGQSRLRTETAGIVACSMIDFLNE